MAMIPHLIYANSRTRVSIKIMEKFILVFYSIKDPYIAKRRTANHPCPVCGKHYVNEGSLRKHLACHPETAQLATSLRMWPCSVCQAVFTHESGTHIPYFNTQA